jgi:branched-chain amino acid transport system ATP-binding protein
VTAVSEQTAKLEVASLQIGYGDLVAVWDVSLNVSPGRTCALVGRNGAGKTTALLGIAGLLKPRAGKVRVGGTDITGLAPHRRASIGLSLVLEGKRIFRPMTVQENLVLGAFGPKSKTRATDTKSGLEEAYERFPMLAERRTKLAGDLSGGQQQMLAIAQALMSRPRFLMLDEPSSGLAPSVVDAIFDVIGQLKAEGMGIVLVEQLVEEMLSGVADDIVVLDSGRVVLSGAAADLSVERLASLVYASDDHLPKDADG